MTRRLLALAALSFLLVACQKANDPTTSAVEINGQWYPVEVARTAAERTRGLSKRDNLPADTGMLFIFDRPVSANFWMKDMRFALDLLWIADLTVVGITTDVPVPTSTVLLEYLAPQPVTHVLEFNAGWAAKNKITAGDEVTFLLQ